MALDPIVLGFCRNAWGNGPRPKINHRLSGSVLSVVKTFQSIDRMQAAPMDATADALERTLVERARHGDHEAFAGLVDARLGPTFRTVLAILGNESDARDTTQAIFVQAWRNLPALRDPDLFAAWFGRIVVNAARTSMRGRRRRAVREISLTEFTDAGDSLTAGGSAHDERTASNDRLERAFERITPDERQCLWLHHHEGLSLAEIGLLLEVSAKTVKSRLFTARRALERELAAEDR
jgi:RNA polymerase sigma-70 factor, ECF subfamily